MEHLDVALNPSMEKEPEKPSPPTRVAVIIALSAGFWGLIAVCAVAIYWLLG